MIDATEAIGNSLVQHGPGDDRVYLVQLHPSDAPEIIGHLEHLARSRGYSKVCAKVPAGEAGRFVAAGYHLEAAIPYFSREGDSACFMAKYFSPERKVERIPLLVREILIAADAQQRAGELPLPAGFTWRMAEAADADAMAGLCRELFADQPAGLHDPAFIRAAMQENTRFLGVWQGAHLVALSAAQVDSAACSADMTRFAILPKFRKEGLALLLLQQMEEKLLPLGIRSLYATVRAYSFGINITFARNGYRFGGTLTNHNNICGRLESANVWHKGLPDDPVLAWRSLYEGDSASRNAAEACSSFR